MTRCCACCRMPAKLECVHHGTVDGMAVLLGLCRGCSESNRRLPAGTRQKRLNAAAALAASDSSGRYYAATFDEPGAAALAAHMIGHPTMAGDTIAALGWI